MEGFKTYKAASDYFDKINLNEGKMKKLLPSRDGNIVFGCYSIQQCSYRVILQKSNNIYCYDDKNTNCSHSCQSCFYKGSVNQLKKYIFDVAKRSKKCIQKVKGEQRYNCQSNTCQYKVNYEIVKREPAPIMCITQTAHSCSIVAPVELSLTLKGWSSYVNALKSSHLYEAPERSGCGGKSLNLTCKGCSTFNVQASCPSITISQDDLLVVKHWSPWHAVDCTCEKTLYAREMIN